MAEQDDLKKRLLGWANKALDKLEGAVDSQRKAITGQLSGQAAPPAPPKPAREPIPLSWRGPYLKKAVPLDPWGRAYLYKSPGEHNASGYDLYTLGRDGQPGGEDEDADITSWK